MECLSEERVMAEVQKAVQIMSTTPVQRRHVIRRDNNPSTVRLPQNEQEVWYVYCFKQ
jgi:hypothetical protein